ncbi:hypothetical protein JCM16161A_24020 [Vulcanisaeta sp. JCM 16161]|uniref:TIGR00304 family membrane protein n=1 Tax=Vulcanisaeta sp. JCM 16161 TaxID=1295372 RepID=UPI0006CFF034|nr:DUF131 domain-containing protein [Vulcanisaeta sp. JCM 16161]
MNTAYIIGIAVILSIVLALLGIALIMIDILRSHKEEDKEEGEERREERKSGVGGVVLIGPVPIIFGNDPSIIKWAIVLTIVIVVLFVILTLLPGIL